MHIVGCTTPIRLRLIRTVIITSYYWSAGNVFDTNWQKFPCYVLYTGRVFWIPSGSFKSSCELNMYRFPFDIQLCSLVFGDIVNIASTVHVYADSKSSDFASLLPNKEFR